MKYFKLFLISVIVFGLIFFLLSLLFPTVTYVSRAKNIYGVRDSVRKALPQLFTKAFNQPGSVTVKDYYSNADTLHFTVKNQEQVSGAMAVYAMGNDSTTVQVFYQINVPWYMPWQKFGLMINEVKYGPSLDSALSHIEDFSE